MGVTIKEILSKVKEVKKKPEIEEELEDEELSLEERIALVQQLRAQQQAEIARRQLALASQQKPGKAPSLALEQVAAAAPRTPAAQVTEGRVEQRSEERTTGYSEQRREYTATGANARPSGATYQPNRPKEGERTYETKTNSNAPTLQREANEPGRRPETFAERREMPSNQRDQTYISGAKEEKDKKKNIW